MMTGDEEKVTPYVGVWIETAIEARVIAWVASLLMWECGLKHTRLAVVRKDAASLLMWECGLKPNRYNEGGVASKVTPYVGVKRNKMEEEQDALDVTPYVGVWIETLRGWRYL